MSVKERYIRVTTAWARQLSRRLYYYIKGAVSLPVNYGIYFFRRLVLLQSDQWARRLSNDAYLTFVETKAQLKSPRFQLVEPLANRANAFIDGPLTPDNLHVHGLWIGTELSKLEILTIKSFLAQGHVFHLWVYDPIVTPLPEGTIVENANEIIPQERVFRYKHVNKYGHGKGSVSGFSDIFRYKLLYDKGGWWTDMDVTCLLPLNAASPYFFRKHQTLDMVGNVMKTPAGAPLMLACYEEASREVNEENTDWHKPIEILNKHVRLNKLQKYITAHVSNLDDWKEIVAFIVGNEKLPPSYRFIHWMNEEWRSREIDKNDLRYRSCLGQIMKHYHLIDYPDNELAILLNDFRHLVWKRIYYYS